MKHFTLLLLLLAAPSLANAQIEISNAPPPAKVANALDTIRQNQPIQLKLKVGEFEIAKFKKAEGETKEYPLYWLPSNRSCLSIKNIKPGVEVEVFGLRAGDVGEHRWYTLPAQPNSWSLLKGENPGKSTIEVIRNGNDEKMIPAYTANTIEATITGGKPNPPPGPVDPDVDPPNPNVDTDLAKALKPLLLADKSTTTTDWNLAKKWASSYMTTAALLRSGDPAMPKPKTVGDLYAAHKGGWMGMGVPNYPFLSKTRDYISAMLKQELGKDDATLDTKKAADLFSRIGAALEEALK